MSLFTSPFFAPFFPLLMGKEPGKETCGGAGSKPPASLGISQYRVSWAPRESQNMNLSFRNLLLPKRVPAERPWARVCVKLYHAEGLPSMSAGIMGGFSKIIGEKKVFIDPYVQVSFCGQQVSLPGGLHGARLILPWLCWADAARSLHGTQQSHRTQARRAQVLLSLAVA